jgi:hypothetical protein
MSLSLTSRLEAVNSMLMSIGEAPINQLDGLTVDAAIAEATLDEVSRSVQSIGWHFNTEKEFPLTRTVDNKIPITSDIVRIDLLTYEYIDIDAVQRNGFLYDRKNHTFFFDKDLKAEVVRLLDWDDLPQPARNYIIVKATRMFQTRVVGSDTLAAQLSADELSSLVVLKEFDADTGDHTVFDNYSVAQVLDR